MNPRKALIVAALLVATTVFCFSSTSAMTPEGSRQEKKSDDLEATVRQLAQQVKSLTAQVTQQARALSQMKTKRAAGSSHKVAFYAWSSDNPFEVNAQSTFRFNLQHTNDGNAFDNSTGVFTAPTSGMYFFQTVFISWDVGEHTAQACIYVDAKMLAKGISDTTKYYDQTTINIVTHLNTGQRVYVHNPAFSKRKYVNMAVAPFTTFSGFLIYED